LMVRDKYYNHATDAEFPASDRNIHWSVNFASTLIGILHGEDDFDKAIQIATLCGWDSDCNAGIVGGFIATMYGAGSIPDKWKAPVRNGYLNYGGMVSLSSWDTIRNMAATSQSLAELYYIVPNGGSITGSGQDAIYHINTDIQDTDLYTGASPQLPTATPTPGSPAQVKNSGFEETNTDGALIPPNWEVLGYGKFEYMTPGTAGSRGFGWSEIAPRTEAGLYQLVYGVIPGNRYRLTAKMSANSVYPASLGIDPYGGRNPNSPTVQYCAESTSSSYITLFKEAVAMTDRITIFLRGTSTSDYFISMQWVKVDEVALTDLGASGTPVPTKIPTSGGYLLGDPSCDGSITPGDALLAFQFYLEIQLPATTPCDQFKAADVNLSNSVTPADALCIFKMYMEMPC